MKTLTVAELNELGVCTSGLQRVKEFGGSIELSDAGLRAYVQAFPDAWTAPIWLAGCLTEDREWIFRIADIAFRGAGNIHPELLKFIPLSKDNAARAAAAAGGAADAAAYYAGADADAAGGAADAAADAADADAAAAARAAARAADTAAYAAAYAAYAAAYAAADAAYAAAYAAVKRECILIAFQAMKKEGII